VKEKLLRVLYNFKSVEIAFFSLETPLLVLDINEKIWKKIPNIPLDSMFRW